MKAVGRSLMWWPGIDLDIERTVPSCDTCRRSRPKPAEAPLQTWSFPERPWSRLHIDYAGPFMGKMILMAIEAHSKWIEAHVTSGSTSTITINKLRMMFRTHGIPDTIISDNDSAFVGQEFQNCCRVNGIQHITSAPHHPASNALGERAVGIVKEGVKRMHGGDLEAKLARFLFDYRVTPHSTTGIAPSELLMHSHLKMRLHLIKPDVGGKVAAQQTKQKGMHDRHAKARFFASGDAAYALRYHGNKESWVHGCHTSCDSMMAASFDVTWINCSEESPVPLWRHLHSGCRSKLGSHCNYRKMSSRPASLIHYNEVYPVCPWTRQHRTSGSTVRLLLYQ